MWRVNSRPVITVTAFVLPVLLVFFLLNLPSSAAQEPADSDQTAPVRVVPPSMEYQVPANADELSDFVPPGLGTTELTPDPHQPLLTPSIGSNGMAIALGNRLAIVVEENTFPQLTRFRLNNLETIAPPLGR